MAVSEGNPVLAEVVSCPAEYYEYLSGRLTL
jgi:hypothetical protein